MDGRTWIHGLLALGALAVAASGMSIHRYKRVCYLSSEAFVRYIPHARFIWDHLDPLTCTHVVYTFAKLDIGNLTIVPALEDDEAVHYPALNSLKERNSALKTLLSIGGPNVDPKDFETLSRSNSKMEAFAANVIALLREHDFNGVELDWQFPGDVSSAEFPSIGKSLLVELVQKLKEAFVADGRMRDQGRLLLSLAVGVTPKHVENSYSFPELSKLSDFITLRTCDYHGSWDRRSGMNSPLFPAHAGDKLSISSTVAEVLEQGATPDKLVITLCAKGSTFTLVSDTDTGVEAETSGPGIQGPFVQRLGTMAYFEVCVVLREKGTELWEDTQKNPYVVRDRLWIGYDNPRSYKEKLGWLVEQKLGGAAQMSLDQDDFAGKFCGQEPFPLTSSISSFLKAADVAFFSDVFGTTAGTTRATTITRAASSSSSSSSPTAGGKATVPSGLSSTVTTEPSSTPRQDEEVKDEETAAAAQEMLSAGAAASTSAQRLIGVVMVIGAVMATV